MALSLANKLGVKHGLQAFSLHPGAIMTNLGSHLDWNVDMEGLCKCPMVLTLVSCYSMFIVSVYRQLGEKEGWDDQAFTLKTLDRGTATHVYASFDPSLKGMFYPWVDETPITNLSE